MFNLFRKEEWELSVVEGITHKDHGVQVTLDRMPCRIEKNSRKRRFLYTDYGSDLATRLGKFMEQNSKIFMSFHNVTLGKELGVEDTVITITTSKDFEDPEKLNSEILEVLAGAIDKAKIKPK